jgi:signal peptidase
MTDPIQNPSSTFGPQPHAPANPPAWGVEFDQARATVEALQGAAALLQNAMDQRQSLWTEMRVAEQSLSRLRQQSSQAEQALAEAQAHLERTSRGIEQVRFEQSSVVAEFDKLVQGALARRSAVVQEIADLERRRDELSDTLPTHDVSQPPIQLRPTRELPTLEHLAHWEEPVAATVATVAVAPLPHFVSVSPHLLRPELEQPIDADALLPQFVPAPLLAARPELDEPTGVPLTPFIAPLGLQPALDRLVLEPRAASGGPLAQFTPTPPLFLRHDLETPAAEPQATFRVPIVQYPPAPPLTPTPEPETASSARLLTFVSPPFGQVTAAPELVEPVAATPFVTIMLGAPEAPVAAASPPPAATVAALKPDVRSPGRRFGVRQAFTIVLSGTLLGLAVLLTPVSQVIGGMQLLAVMSGSMEPTIQVGGIVGVRPVPASELKVGDVITFANQSSPDLLVTHRIVSVEARGSQTFLTTKGDANDSVDALATATTRAVGRVDFTLPLLGYLMMWLAAPLAKVGILVVSIVGLAWPKATGTAKRSPAAATAAAEPAGVKHVSSSYTALERELHALLPI